MGYSGTVRGVLWLFVQVAKNTTFHHSMMEW